MSDLSESSVCFLTRPLIASVIAFAIASTFACSSDVSVLSTASIAFVTAEKSS